VPYETEFFFLLCFTRSLFARLAVLIVVMCEQLQIFIFKIKLKHCDPSKYYELSAQWHSVTSQKIRIFISVVDSAEIASKHYVSPELWHSQCKHVRIHCNNQKHRSKLVQWQCITYTKDSNHVKIFIYFLANRQISTYTSS